MARQKGNMKIEGTIGDLTYYRIGNNYFVRAKRQVSRERILKAPEFLRVRENGNEFGLAAKAGKLLRELVKGMHPEAGRKKTSARLLQLLIQIQKTDSLSKRGKRNVGTALLSPTVKAILKGFEFNDKSQIGSILFKPYTVNTVTGVIVISNLVPVNDITVPQGATHLTLRGAYANVNFTDGVTAIDYTNEVNLPIDGISTTVTLTPTAAPLGTGTKFYLLQIEFFQMVNAVQYELNNGSFNALVIAEIA